jgi:hypothetical protein
VDLDRDVRRQPQPVDAVDRLQPARAVVRSVEINGDEAAGVRRDRLRGGRGVSHEDGAALLSEEVVDAGLARLVELVAALVLVADVSRRDPASTESTGAPSRSRASSENWSMLRTNEVQTTHLRPSFFSSSRKVSAHSNFAGSSRSSR